MSPQDLCFVHHAPKLRNIGDDLCSPRHYFEFSGPRSRIAIIGGGVFSDLGEAALGRLGIAPADAVLWGVGRSAPLQDALPQPVVSLPYAAWGLRDPDAIVDPRRFLPCVSCLHPMLDRAPAGDRTLLFLNADVRVTPADEVPALRAFSGSGGWDFLQNSCTDDEMAAALARCARIVTNSFHGAYWALLSGRAVKVFGYSSKFESLLLALELPTDALLRYRKPGTDWRWLRPLRRKLVDQLRPLRDAGFQALPAAGRTLERFRNLNRAFATGLAADGTFRDVRERTPRPASPA